MPSLADRLERTLERPASTHSAASEHPSSAEAPPFLSPMEQRAWRLVAQTREREGPEQEKLRRRQARLESAVAAAEALAHENALGHGAAGLRQQLATQSQRREEAELAASESFVREDELTQRRDELAALLRDTLSELEATMAAKAAESLELESAQAQVESLERQLAAERQESSWSRRSVAAELEGVRQERGTELASVQAQLEVERARAAAAEAVRPQFLQVLPLA